MKITRCICCGKRPDVLDYQIVCECGHSSPRLHSSMRLLIKVWEKLNTRKVVCDD